MWGEEGSKETYFSYLGSPGSCVGLYISVLTSARLRSIKASRELIQELGAETNAPSRHFPPRVPAHKLSFTLEGITRTLNGWNIPGGWVEGMGLVRAATGQVFKVCSNPVVGSDPPEQDGAARKPEPGSHGLHPESLDSIAEINHWRCSGFPLYGQVRTEIFIFLLKLFVFVLNPHKPKHIGLY